LPQAQGNRIRRIFRLKHGIPQTILLEHEHGFIRILHLNAIHILSPLLVQTSKRKQQTKRHRTDVTNPTNHNIIIHVANNSQQQKT
jgi:hypothetical protein